MVALPQPSRLRTFRQDAGRAGELVGEGPSPLALDDRDLLERWLTLEVYDQSGELIGVRHADFGQ